MENHLINQKIKNKLNPGRRKDNKDCGRDKQNREQKNKKKIYEAKICFLKRLMKSTNP